MWVRVYISAMYACCTCPYNSSINTTYAFTRVSYSIKYNMYYIILYIITWHGDVKEYFGLWLIERTCSHVHM